MQRLGLCPKPIRPPTNTRKEEFNSDPLWRAHQSCRTQVTSPPAARRNPISTVFYNLINFVANTLLTARKLLHHLIITACLDVVIIKDLGIPAETYRVSHTSSCSSSPIRKCDEKALLLQDVSSWYS